MAKKYLLLFTNERSTREQPCFDLCFQKIFESDDDAIEYCNRSFQNHGTSVLCSIVSETQHIFVKKE